MEVMRLEGPLAAVEAVVPMDPRACWRIEASVRRRYRYPSGDRGPGRVAQVQLQPAGRPQRTPFGHGERALCAADHIMQPQLEPAVLIRQVSDLPSIRRPAGTDRVKLAIRDRQRIAAAHRHQP